MSDIEQQTSEAAEEKQIRSLMAGLFKKASAISIFTNIATAVTGHYLYSSLEKLMSDDEEFRLLWAALPLLTGAILGCFLELAHYQIRNQKEWAKHWKKPSYNPPQTADWIAPLAVFMSQLSPSLLQQWVKFISNERTIQFICEMILPFLSSATAYAVGSFIQATVQAYLPISKNISADAAQKSKDPDEVTPLFQSVTFASHKLSRCGC